MLTNEELYRNFFEMYNGIKNFDFFVKLYENNTITYDEFIYRTFDSPEKPLYASNLRELISYTGGLDLYINPETNILPDRVFKYMLSNMKSNELTIGVGDNERKNLIKKVSCLEIPSMPDALENIVMIADFIDMSKNTYYTRIVTDNGLFLIKELVKRYDSELDGFKEQAGLLLYHNGIEPIDLYYTHSGDIKPSNTYEKDKPLDCMLDPRSFTDINKWDSDDYKAVMNAIRDFNVKTLKKKYTDRLEVIDFTDAGNDPSIYNIEIAREIGPKSISSMSTIFHEFMHNKLSESLDYLGDIYREHQTEFSDLLRLMIFKMAEMHELSIGVDARLTTTDGYYFGIEYSGLYIMPIEIGNYSSYVSDTYFDPDEGFSSRYRDNARRVRFFDNNSPLIIKIYENDKVFKFEEYDQSHPVYYNLDLSDTSDKILEILNKQKKYIIDKFRKVVSTEGVENGITNRGLSTKAINAGEYCRPLLNKDKYYFRRVTDLEQSKKDKNFIIHEFIEFGDNDIDKLFIDKFNYLNK